MNKKKCVEIVKIVHAFIGQQNITTLHNKKRVQMIKVHSFICGNAQHIATIFYTLSSVLTYFLQYNKSAIFYPYFIHITFWYYNKMQIKSAIKSDISFILHIKKFHITINVSFILHSDITIKCNKFCNFYTNKIFF